MTKKLITLLALLVPLLSFGQKTFPVNGVRDERPGLYAFTNATIFVDYKTKIENATLIVKNNVIEAVGANISIPKGAIVTDLKGKTIYPSFIDAYSDYGMPEVVKPARTFGQPQYESNRKGAYAWNQALKPEAQAGNIFTANEKKAEELRKLGFGAALTFNQDGIARGTSAFVSLAEGKENDLIIRNNVSAHYAFDKGTSQQAYPSSQMGSIALLRQTYLDAKWYSQPNSGAEYNLSLDAWNKNQNIPQIFESPDKLSLLRADKIGDEFGVQYIIKGAGDEYQRIDQVKATRASLIIPVNYPMAYDVEDPLEANNLSLADLKHWELTPTNAAVLAKNGVEFSLTAAGLKNKSEFLANVKKAIESGLSQEDALKALTFTPAKQLKVDDKVGTLRKGMLANFIITSGSVFEKEAVIFENWVQGKRYKFADIQLTDIRGVYNLSVANVPNLKLSINGKPESPEFQILKNDTTKISVKATKANDLLILIFDPKDEKVKGDLRLSGWLQGKDFKGQGQTASGEWIKWSATFDKVQEVSVAKKDTVKNTTTETGKVIYPFIAFGATEQPKQENILIKNATVWTNEKEGVLPNTDVLIQNGKIAAIGKNLDAKGAKVIDATGKHFTPGIIDEHSHIAISSSLNEATQSVTAEVRIGDVVDSEDINIYRQLSGGVVASQLLHGSANSIGGQSALIKLRWGQAPEDMKIKGADEFIKFALGENVKQANWDFNTIRFPQTRMGVEQVFIDAFTAAKAYQKTWEKYNTLPAKEKAATPMPRKDLELEALVEILNNRRHITCHSYIQSEINMLMKVAEQMGFRVNTFTHILEGYKVADKMAKHGAGGSTFADWWAYKMEVKDAIPYNSVLMTNAGVITAINSDDAEMGRRLNQEAAKAVKYGNMSEEDALKMVTLNPAKLLHLDKTVGSIKVGKDADVVLWSEHPLSIYAKAEKTFVDGIVYFDREKDKELRAEMAKEKGRLVAKLREAKKGGQPTQKAGAKAGKMFHCEDIFDVYSSQILHVHQD